MQNVPAGPEKTKQNVSQVCVKFESTHQVEIFGQYREISVNEWWLREIVNNGLTPEDRLALNHIVGDLWQMWTSSFFGLWTANVSSL